MAKFNLDRQINDAFATVEPMSAFTAAIRTSQASFEATLGQGFSRLRALTAGNDAYVGATTQSSHAMGELSGARLAVASTIAHEGPTAPTGKRGGPGLHLKM